MHQATMIDELLKRGAVRRVEWASPDALAAVEFYPPDPMQDMMKKAIENGGKRFS